MHFGTVPFVDRSDAGRRLAARLYRYAGRSDVLVLALPRGGVPVGYEIARALSAPLDVFVVRKLGVPGYEEVAMGALASGGIRVLNPDVLSPRDMDLATFEQVTAREQRELERRERVYRDGRPAPGVTGRTVILVDDGIATGSTMLAAARALRNREPERLIVAVPVAPAAARVRMQPEADEYVCLFEPAMLYAISMYYARFPQTTDEEVRDLLARARVPVLT